MPDLPADQDLRGRALSVVESFHLEAPAGSGKTAVLLARLLALLAQVQEPEELLALTFTRKAAGELRTRLFKLIRQEDLPSHPSPWDLRLQDLAQQVFRRHGDAAALKLSPERLPVTTFHSFCARLLRLAPQAGIPLDFQVLEGREADWVREEALEEMRRRLAARPADDPVRLALVRRLVRLNNDWPRLARELAGLLARRDSLGEFIQLARLSRSPEAYQGLLEERFLLVLTPNLQALREEFAASPLGADWEGFWRELHRAGASLAEKLPRRIPGSRREDLPWWQAIAEALLTQNGAPRKQLIPKYGFPPNFAKTSWGDLIKELPEPAAHRLQQCREWSPEGVPLEEAAAVQDLVLILWEALTVYEELCAARRALDFIALEQAALKLLDVENPSDLLLSLDCRIKHLLVDEFQDTSDGQMELLCRLLAEWAPGDGRTLAVVGDPKQSIYGWRQAKVRLFLESRLGLPCRDKILPLEPLPLSVNFRADRTLIDWVNQVFGETVMHPDSSPGGVEFYPADPGPQAPPGEAPFLALFPARDGTAGREAEARWLARQLKEAAAVRQPGEKIGVLLFARTHLAFYLQALGREGLSVQVREGLKLADSRVAGHLHNLAAALARPQDGVAWAGVVMGPWGPQSLELLARVAQTPGGVWPEKLRRFLQEDDSFPYFRPVWGSVLSARDLVGRRPLGEIIQGWLDENLAWQGLAAWEGPGGVANARAYLDLLMEAESGLPEENLARADFYLKEAYQPPDPRAVDSPVEILTVHGAKGLEFHHLFLPFLDWQPLRAEDKTPPFLLEEIPGSPYHGLALARAYAQENHSSLYQMLKQIKDRRILDEARRVFYVAATRARRRLVLSGVVKLNKDGESLVPPDSPLGWLWRHYGHPQAYPGMFAWPDPEVKGEVFFEVPAVPPVTALGTEPVEDLAPPWDFTPEAAPYEMLYPSRLAKELEGDEVVTSEAEVAADAAMIRGRVTHRLLDAVAHGEVLPSENAVAAALGREGLTWEAAQELAPEILGEAAACRDDPFLGRLLAPAPPFAASEWLLEDQPEPGVIRRGVMDRLAFDGNDWWLLDYKTSRPDKPEDWDAFMAREKEKYAPQLRAYREMAARAKNIPPEAIRMGLFFTACRRVMELD
jgi:ATP-dependent exoDNAse (exonuclease V) beta subunit